MQIVILSGGSGSRLWPLSNDARSKQFLKVLPKDEGEEKESMIQRVVRQISESGLEADISVATSLSQRDSVVTQLGGKVNIITEPSRRHTFGAICLAAEYLSLVKKCSKDETVVIMPCDPFTGIEYYRCIAEMAKAVESEEFNLMLMGVAPTYPSSKYGYILPSISQPSRVEKFVEKPSVEEANSLIEKGALWNSGVFTFPLWWMLEISQKYIKGKDYSIYLDNYTKYPETSFDYEVLEKTKDMGVVKFDGYWKDLGTWNTLTDEIPEEHHGNVITDGSSVNTHIFNELNIPLLCLGTKDLVVAASHDGILVTEKSKSENVKKYIGQIKKRPMYEERRWGSYKVIDFAEFPDNFHALTKQLTLNPGCSISYQRHSCRDEVWTFIDGEGELVLDGIRQKVKRGDVINIPKGTCHALRAITSLTFIEVQHGSTLVEEDIERFPYRWD